MMTLTMGAPALLDIQFASLDRMSIISASDPEQGALRWDRVS